jgi:hypothetical protein
MRQEKTFEAGQEQIEHTDAGQGGDGLSMVEPTAE